MELSIIIPTLNEEKLLPFLLELIKQENTKIILKSLLQMLALRIKQYKSQNFMDAR
jgi:glycosyltransferase involved in cell wall biosynthesis